MERPQRAWDEHQVVGRGSNSFGQSTPQIVFLALDYTCGMSVASERTSSLFGRDHAIIGMVHVGALPGTPAHREPLSSIVDRACREAKLLRDAGFDAVMLENMHDVPYLLREVGPEIVAAMTRVAVAVRAVITGPLGLQILAGANRAALAVAHAADCSFIRAEGFVFASVADEGLFTEADAGQLLRYRKAIGAEEVGILTDIKKKHSSHAITADITIAENASAAEFFGADGVIMTGPATLHAAAATCPFWWEVARQPRRCSRSSPRRTLSLSEAT
jgi:hypothetical protein